jgi:hypothetical protein
VHHCGIDVNWEMINAKSVFTVNEFFNDNNLLGMKVKVKEYDPMLTKE